VAEGGGNDCDAVGFINVAAVKGDDDLGFGVWGLGFEV